MNKVEAITELQRRAEALQAMGATSLYLFGSVVRDEAKAASDLDLFIDYDRDGRYLENELSVDFDVTLERMHVTPALSGCTGIDHHGGLRRLDSARVRPCWFAEP